VEAPRLGYLERITMKFYVFKLFEILNRVFKMFCSLNSKESSEFSTTFTPSKLIEIVEIPKQKSLSSNQFPSCRSPTSGLE
jgi:hypothetical protein